jgi:hypothetical protein
MLLNYVPSNNEQFKHFLENDTSKKFIESVDGHISSAQIRADGNSIEIITGLSC